MSARVAGDTHAGDVAGPNTNLQIQPGTVGSLEIANGSIDGVDLAADSVGSGNA